VIGTPDSMATSWPSWLQSKKKKHVPSGNQTWQCEIPYNKWWFNEKIIHKWWIWNNARLISEGYFTRPRPELI
jgi:hypothetical protein